MATQSWETEAGWEEVVASPVVRHRMAPREAVAILTAAGEALDEGVDPDRITRAITELTWPDPLTPEERT